MPLNENNINKPISIDLKDLYENYNLSSYISCASIYESRIKSDKKSEESLKSDYSGRELYEMIQNADDQKAQSVEIELDSHDILHIRNDGGIPFSNKGLISVLRPHQSSKERAIQSTDYPIGNKGLGIRSLLNWSDGITIHSNGVKVEFSKDIAIRRWHHILEQTPTLRGLEINGECPLAILSVPNISEDFLTRPDNNSKWTTEIELSCHKMVLHDIKSKIAELQPEVLLFLKNIRNLTLKIHNDIIELSRSDYSSEPTRNGSIFNTKLKGHNQCHEYVVYRESTSPTNTTKNNQSEEIEIAIAYSTNSERYCDYLHSFFPTRIPLRLPCALHANFHLTMSRNELVQDSFNSILMEKLGKLLVKAAEDRAKSMAEKPNSLSRQLPMKMLFIEKSTSKILPDFADTVNDAFETSLVIPTIDGKFKALRNGVYHSSHVELSEFKQHFNQSSNLNHYLDYETSEHLRKIGLPPHGLEYLYNDLSELASNLEINELGKLILYLLNIEKWQTKPNILKLDNGNMADSANTVYMLESKDMSALANSSDNTLDRTILPKELKLNILNPHLSKYLQKRLNTDARGVTKELKKIAEVTDADFSRVKQEIENKSPEMSPEDLKGILLWLFTRWQKDRSDNLSSSVPPECHKFFLCNVFGDHKPACSLLLECDNNEYRLIDTLQEAIPKDSRKEFFIDYLQCAASIPVKAVDFSNDDEYINMVAKPNLQYVKKCDPWKNKALIPIADFIETKSKEEIISLILKDPRYLTELRENKRIYYSHYGINSHTVSFGYATYWLTKRKKAPLSSIENYVIPTGTSIEMSPLNEGILDLSKINTPTKSDLYNLLEILGAKRDPLELTYAQLYRLLEAYDSPEKVQSIYKEIRSIIMAKERIQKDSPTDADKELLKSVWAIGPNGKRERKPKSEVYYWDNSKLPNKFLESLWKLCIGSRIGEQSVHNIFGVKLLSELNLHVIPNEYNISLTQAIKGFLESRYKYLVATSLKTGDYKIETIREKASQIRNFISSFRISSKITYETSGKRFDAIEGDVISDNGTFYICSSLSTYKDAIDNPQICSNLAKGLCLKLLVDVENEIRFKHVIQSSQKTLDFDWNELDETLRNDITKTIGLSDEEKKFWAKLGIYLDDSDIDLKQRRTKIINQIPNIIIPENLVDIKDLSGSELYTLLLSLSETDRRLLTGLYSLTNYYRSQLEGEIENLYTYYRCITFEATRTNLKERHDIGIISKWLKDIETFDHSIKKSFDEYCNNLSDKFYELKELQINFAESVKKEHTLLNHTIEAKVPYILPKYDEILSKHNVSISELTDHEQAIAYFDDFYTEFENIVNQKTSHQTSSTNKGDLLEKSDDTISFIKPSNNSTHASYKAGFPNSQTKNHIGKTAENKVREYLESQPDVYESLIDVSSRYEHHCDMMYRYKNNPSLRYLEIKSVNGHKIYFSPGEIEKGRSNPDSYDLALVYDNKVRIITNAFKEDGDLIKNLTPGSYEIALKFSKDE